MLTYVKMNDTQSLLKFNLIIFVKRLKKNVEIEKKTFSHR